MTEFEAVCSIAQTLVRMRTDTPTKEHITRATLDATQLLHTSDTSWVGARIELERRMLDNVHRLALGARDGNAEGGQ
jgi:hypothetical protein